MPSISSSYAFVFLKEKDFWGGGGIRKNVSLGGGGSARGEDGYYYCYKGVNKVEII